MRVEAQQAREGRQHVVVDGGTNKKEEIEVGSSFGLLLSFAVSRKEGI